MDFMKKVKRYVFGEVCNPHGKDWECSLQGAGDAGALSHHTAWLRNSTTHESIWDAVDQGRTHAEACSSAPAPDGADPARARRAAQARRRAGAAAAVPAAQPVLQSAGYGASGGVQGLNWYAEQLREDRDGDTADEFLVEPSATPATPTRTQAPQGADPAGLRPGPPPVQPRTDPALKVQHRHLKAARRGDVVVLEGNVHIVPPA